MAFYKHKGVMAYRRCTAITTSSKLCTRNYNTKLGDKIHGLCWQHKDTPPLFLNICKIDKQTIFKNSTGTSRDKRQKSWIEFYKAYISDVDSCSVLNCVNKKLVGAHIESAPTHQYIALLCQSHNMTSKPIHIKAGTYLVEIEPYIT